jgi:transmembrane sensor
MSDNQNIDIELFTKNYKVPEGTSKQEVWKKIEKRILIEEGTRNPKRKVIPLYALISLAAATVIYCIFYFGFIYESNYSTEKATQFGEVQKLWLPDSSLIEMNSNSSVRYNYSKLTGHRKVMLKGDALFNVKKGKDFVVSFYDGDVKVRGTSFYISAYSPNLLQIDCISGSVDVTLNNQLYSLQKGEGIKRFNGKISAPYTCNEKDVTDRLTGLFYWDKVSLAEIDELMEYRFGYNIFLEPGLEKRNFSGQLDLKELQQSLTIISMAMNVQYSIDEERKTIKIDEK